MKIQRIQELTDASIVCGSEKRENDVQCAFASDLMSDVLTLDCGDVLLVTGLCNLLTIRTAEMAEVSYILFVRGKKVTPDMLELARENNMVLLETDHSMYHTVGELIARGSFLYIKKGGREICYLSLSWRAVFSRRRVMRLAR